METETFNFSNLFLLPYPDNLRVDFSYVVPKRDLEEAIEEEYYKKEKEWIDLIGKERWYALELEKRNFLIQTAGIIDLGKVDIKKAFEYYE
mgnify:CR=1 FL=1